MTEPWAVPPDAFVKMLKPESQASAAERLQVATAIMADSLTCTACWAPGLKVTMTIGEEHSGITRPFVVCRPHADRLIEAMAGELGLRQWEAYRRKHEGGP